MIKFKTVKWKNFLSTGDDFTIINLDKSPSTLIVGQNGAGKSTILDALSFGLFGKAHRNINKTQLVNSVNNKKCLVEVEFVVFNQHFKIVRGIKPTKFEIWQDGNLINQDSHAKGYQRILEQNILKLNYKSFHQIVVLGSSSFIPFMQLPAQARREVIEDLLDINIFSKMNTVLKEKSAILKDKLTGNAHDLDLQNTKINSQEDHIFELEKISEVAKSKTQDELKLRQSELARLEKVVEDYSNDQLKRLEKELNDLKDQLTILNHDKHNCNEKLKLFKKDIKFYEDNDTCPTCDQEISTDTKNKKIGETTKEGQIVAATIIALNEEGKDLETLLQETLEQGKIESSKKDEFFLAKVKLKQLKVVVATLQSRLSNWKEIESLEPAYDALTELKNEKEFLLETKTKLIEEREYNSVITEMLKDTGIKTKIIKQYLPAMNKLINQYLQVLDFFVSFYLDENFDEVIRSRHRDAFDYASFSEGEKQRIDLALLFTWRQIAKMKNSANTNLLILDETFDSSLDVDGVDNLTKILDTLQSDTNVFIISHKGDVLENKFRSKIEFHKEGNFSKIK